MADERFGLQLSLFQQPEFSGGLKTVETSDDEEDKRSAKKRKNRTNKLTTDAKASTPSTNSEGTPRLKHYPDLFDEENLERRLFQSVCSSRPARVDPESYSQLDQPLTPIQSCNTDTRSKAQAQELALNCWQWRQGLKTLLKDKQKYPKDMLMSVSESALRGEVSSIHFKTRQKLQIEASKWNKLRDFGSCHPMGCITSPLQMCVAYNKNNGEGDRVLYGDWFGNYAMTGNLKAAGNQEQVKKAFNSSHLRSIRVLEEEVLVSSEDNTSTSSAVGHFRTTDQILLSPLRSDTSSADKEPEVVIEVGDKEGLVLDSLVIPSHRMIMMATESGNVKLYNLDTRLSSNVAIVETLATHKWVSLQQPKSELPWHVYLADRKSVRLFDLRSQREGQKDNPLYQFKGCETLGGLCEPIDNHRLFGCTNRQVFVLDNRMPRDLIELCHVSDVSFISHEESVPLGCSMIKVPESSLYYFAWFNQLASSDSCDSLRVACFNESGYRARFPVTVPELQPFTGPDWKLMGRPCRVPSASSYAYNISDQSSQLRLDLPFTGASFILGSRDNLSLYAVNATGDLFQTSFSKSEGAELWVDESSRDVQFGSHAKPFSSVLVNDQLEEFHRAEIMNQNSAGPRYKLAQATYLRDKAPNLAELCRENIQIGQASCQTSDEQAFPSLERDRIDTREHVDNLSTKIAQIMEGKLTFETEDRLDNSLRVKEAKGVNFDKVIRRSRQQVADEEAFFKETWIKFGTLDFAYTDEVTPIT